MRMGEQAVPYLAGALPAADTDLKLSILATLLRMGPTARGALPTVSTLLHDSAPAVRVTAAAVIVASDCSRAKTPEVWTVLKGGLEGDAVTASTAADTIGSLGADGADAVPTLSRLVKSRDSDLQLAAIGALWKIGPPARSALPSLREVATAGGVAATSASSAIETITGKAPTPVPSCQQRQAIQ
jgi:HEAT repeat protein